MKLATHMAVAMEMHGAYTCSLTRDLEAHHLKNGGQRAR